MDLETFIHNLFFTEPKEPCTYTLTLPSDYNGSMFQVLFYILMSGAQILYGKDVRPDDISQKEFNILNKYMLSIGYNIQYSYSCSETNIPILLNIWFKKIDKQLKNCRLNSTKY